MNSVNNESRKQFLVKRACKYSVGTPKENFDECMKDCRKHIIHYLKELGDFESTHGVMPLYKLIDDFKNYRVLDYHATLNKMGYEENGYCFCDFRRLLYDKYGEIFNDKHKVYNDINNIACDYSLIAGLCYIYSERPNDDVFEHCYGYEFSYFEFQ